MWCISCSDHIYKVWLIQLKAGSNLRGFVVVFNPGNKLWIWDKMGQEGNGKHTGVLPTGKQNRRSYHAVSSARGPGVGFLTNSSLSLTRILQATYHQYHTVDEVTTKVKVPGTLCEIRNHSVTSNSTCQDNSCEGNSNLAPHWGINSPWLFRYLTIFYMAHCHGLQLCLFSVLPALHVFSGHSGTDLAEGSQVPVLAFH